MAGHVKDDCTVDAVSSGLGLKGFYNLEEAHIVVVEGKLPAGLER